MHSQFAGRGEGPVHPRNQRGRALPGRQAPVVIPHVDDDDAGLGGVDSFGSLCDLGRLRIAGAQVQGETFGGRRRIMRTTSAERQPQRDGHGEQKSWHV